MSGSVLAFALLVLATLGWGGNLVVGRFIHEQIPPLTLALGRWLVASLVLVPLTWRGLVTRRRVIGRSWRLLLFLGVIGSGLFNALQYVSLSQTEAVNGGLILTAMPVAIFALSFVIFGERATWIQGVGIVVSLIGTVALLARGNLETLATLTFNRGDLWMLGAAPLWALYSVLLRLLPAEIPRLEVVCTTSLAAVAALVPLAAWELSGDASIAWSGQSLASVLYVGLMASVVSYACWNKGVDLIGANRAGIFLHLIPVFGALLAAIFLGEVLRPYHLAGATLVFAGIALTSRRGPGRDAVTLARVD